MIGLIIALAIILNLNISRECSCAYTVLQTVQRPGVYSALYDTVHYKEPSKLFKIRVGHSPGFGLGILVSSVTLKSDNL